MTERSAFLAELRRALGVSASTERTPERFARLFSRPDFGVDPIPPSGRSAEARRMLLTRFRERGEEIRLRVHVAPDSEAAAEIVSTIIGNSQPEFSATKEIIQHDSPAVRALKLPERLAGEAIEVHTLIPDDPAARERTIASFVGVTEADWGIAESATVVQITGPGKSRSTSLVPSIHIALLPAERILADLSELHAVLQARPPESSYVLISGPSKTGDIESQLVFGAHGPRDMHVVVLTGAMSAGGRS